MNDEVIIAIIFSVLVVCGIFQIAINSIVLKRFRLHSERLERLENDLIDRMGT